MASLQKHRVAGHTYWRIVESRRVNGKPRPVPILYLGTADQLLNRLLGTSNGQLRISSFQHGDVAVLKAMADKLEVVSIIDRHVPSSRRALSVGTTLLLAALNRAVKPRSKRGWSKWAKGTSLHRLFSIRPDDLTSQYFWDQMDEVPASAMEAIEDELTLKVVETFGLKLDVLFYDPTNFFTYIASDNSRCDVPQRGHSKQHRSDLRQFSLALLVARDGGIPLCSQVYEGNTTDCKQFPHSLTQIRRRLERLVGEVEDITLVYDKGNNSKKNQALVDGCTFHYVASLSPSHHKELVGIPVEEYTVIADGPLEGLPVYRCRRTIWGKERTVILFVSPTLQAGQIRGLEQELKKRLRLLNEWRDKLARPGSGPRKSATARKKVNALMKGQYISDVLHVEYHSRRKGANRLSWWIDTEARQRLETEFFGKRILITDQDAWLSEDIILAYRGQSHVEKVFKQIKDPEHLAVRPQYHWTDQKIRVHTFICLLGFMLSQLTYREASKAGWKGELSSLLDLLASIRLAMVLRLSAKGGGRPRCEWRLEETDSDTLEMFHKLVPNNEPFVYTR